MAWSGLKRPRWRADRRVDSVIRVRMPTPRLSRKPLWAIVTIACATLPLSCDGSGPVAPSRLTYDTVQPAPGTVLREGTVTEFQVRVTDIPDDAWGVTLSLGVEFETPTGQIDNSYLPGHDPVTVSIPRAGDPVVVASRIALPVGTPSGNRFIPDGSSVREVRVDLSVRRGVPLLSDTLRIAAYPVVR